jgi:histidinol dehydrogenase
MDLIGARVPGVQFIVACAPTLDDREFAPLLAAAATSSACSPIYWELPQWDCGIF